MAAAGNDLIADQLVSFCDELREEGIAIGTAEILDSFAAVEQVPWSDRAQFREALAATLAKSQEDRHLFDRVFDRWFFRAAELEAIEREGDRRRGRRRHSEHEARPATAASASTSTS